MRSILSSALRSSTVPVLAALVAALAAPPVPAASSQNDLSLPGDPWGGEIVHPYGVDVPAACERFLEERGSDWIVVWDRSLGTPRLAVPAVPEPVDPDSDAAGPVTDLPPTATPAQAAAAAALAFIDREREFLGVSSSDLGPVQAVPLDDGWLFGAEQEHQGLGVRGTFVRIRLTGDLRVISVRARTARELPPVAAPVLEEAEAVGLATDGGNRQVLFSSLQIAFPNGTESATPVWSVIVSSEESEEEVIYSAEDGEQLASFSTVFGFDVDCDPADPADDICLVVEGSVTGYGPDPDDVYAMPFEIVEEAPAPLAGLEVTVQRGRGIRDVVVGEDGTFSANIRNLPAAAGLDYGVIVNILDPAHQSTGILPDYGRRTIDFGEGERADIVLNEGLTEYEGLHLLVFFHLQRGLREVEEEIERHGLSVHEGRLATRTVAFSDSAFRSHLFPFSGVYYIRSDESRPRDERGRWRKIVPTMVHHEFGHMAFFAFTNGTKDKAVNEGVSDALAAYISRVSTLGFVDPQTPNAAETSRDIALDRTSFPEDARTTLAGALWELWEETLDVEEPEAPAAERRSTFAFGLLARWLASLGGIEEPEDHRVVDYVWTLGIEFLVEADEPRLGGNRDLRDGAPHWEELIHAFGSRNLYPHAFVRGDADGSKRIDITDAITIFGHLFLGDVDVSCSDALDTDDSGTLEITDGIGLLGRLFLGEGRPAYPFPSCGWDLTPADGLGCGKSPCVLFPAGRR